MLHRSSQRFLSSYSQRMAATGRPISPHVTIYAFPTIAISSITVRITGVALTIGTSAIAATTLLKGDTFTQGCTEAIANSNAAPVAKFAVAFPLTYHYLGGIRHAVWDLTAKGFTNQQMLLSSYALFGASGLISLALAASTISNTKENDS